MEFGLHAEAQSHQRAAAQGTQDASSTINTLENEVPLILVTYSIP